MPNWCHNTLTVDGPEPEVKQFVLRAETHDQPLSFEKFVPQPHPEEFEAMDREAFTDCYMCGGLGVRPRDPEAARATGAYWDEKWTADENPILAVAAGTRCNVCNGEGLALLRGTESSWGKWTYDNWGCKWDASFDGPLMALGTDDGNVEGSVATQGRYVVPGRAIYKFDTPWGPPTVFVKKVSAMFPWLVFTLRFGEWGMEFAGQLTAQAGDTHEMDLDVEEVLSPEEQWF